MSVQDGLCRTWSETTKTGSLTSRFSHIMAHLVAIRGMTADKPNLKLSQFFGAITSHVACIKPEILNKLNNLNSLHFNRIKHNYSSTVIKLPTILDSYKLFLTVSIFVNLAMIFRKLILWIPHQVKHKCLCMQEV